MFDHSNDTVTADVVAELDRTTCASIFQAAGSVKACFQIGGKAKAYYFVATATPVPEGSVPSRVRATMVFERTLANNEIGPAIFEDFLPKALPLCRHASTKMHQNR